MARNNAKGLGKGLGALFNDAPVLEEPSVSSAAPQTLPCHKLEPHRDQPRKDFDEEKLQELADSIRLHGLIEPIVVRPLDSGYYQIIAGERRWRAARMAELREVPVRILEVDDRTAAQMALIENLQREDLNPIEEAGGFQSLMETYGMTQNEAAESVGKSRPAVANALRLLKLPASIRSLISAGELSAGHARALIPLEDEEKQRTAAGKIIAEQLSVRQTEALVKRLLKPEKAPEPKDPLAVDYLDVCQKELTKVLGRKVTIHAGRQKGRFELEYYGDEDMQALIEALRSLKPVSKKS